MADLNNLLAELDDNTQVETEEPLLDSTTAEEEQLQHDDDNDERENAPAVPPALAAAHERKFAENENDDLLKETDANPSQQEHTSLEDEDYARLKSLWVQEMLSPELLPYNADTVSLELELLEGQEDSIDKLLQGATTFGNSNETQLVAEITKLDAQRTQFILQDWLTLRLSKLEAHALYNRQLVPRMSDDEVQYLKSYGELLEKHLARTVLDHLPQEAWKKLDEPDMVEEPDWDRFVFCRVVAEQVEIGTTTMDEGAAEHTAGSCLIARYGSIQQHVLEGSIQLLM